MKEFYLKTHNLPLDRSIKLGLEKRVASLIAQARKSESFNIEKNIQLLLENFPNTKNSVLENILFDLMGELTIEKCETIIFNYINKGFKYSASRQLIALLWQKLSPMKREEIIQVIPGVRIGLLMLLHDVNFLSNDIDEGFVGRELFKLARFFNNSDLDFEIKNGSYFIQRARLFSNLIQMIDPGKLKEFIEKFIRSDLDIFEETNKEFYLILRSLLLPVTELTLGSSALENATCFFYLMMLGCKEKATFFLQNLKVEDQKSIIVFAINALIGDFKISENMQYFTYVNDLLNLAKQKSIFDLVFSHLVDKFLIDQDDQVRFFSNASPSWGELMKDSYLSSKHTLIVNRQFDVATKKMFIKDLIEPVTKGDGKKIKASFKFLLESYYLDIIGDKFFYDAVVALCRENIKFQDRRVINIGLMIENVSDEPEYLSNFMSVVFDHDALTGDALLMEFMKDILALDKKYKEFDGFTYIVHQAFRFLKMDSRQDVINEIMSLEEKIAKEDEDKPHAALEDKEEVSVKEEVLENERVETKKNTGSDIANLDKLISNLIAGYQSYCSNYYLFQNTHAQQVKLVIGFLEKLRENLHVTKNENTCHIGVGIIFDSLERYLSSRNSKKLVNVNNLIDHGMLLSPDQKERYSACIGAIVNILTDCNKRKDTDLLNCIIQLVNSWCGTDVSLVGAVNRVNFTSGSPGA